MLELTQDFGPTLSVYVREFDPVKGDVTSYQWPKSGKQTKLEMPPFAITELEDTQGAIEEYIKESLPAYVEHYVDSGSSIVRGPFQIAIHKARWEKVAQTYVERLNIHLLTSRSQNSFIQRALNLWVATRLIERPWRICGSETLGVQLDDTKETPFAGTIPVPPVMDSQFDQIVIKRILNPLREQVLKILDQKISSYKREEWLEIFLVVFLLLNNIEIATAHDHEFATFHGHVVRRPQFFRVIFLKKEPRY